MRLTVTLALLITCLTLTVWSCYMAHQVYIENASLSRRVREQELLVWELKGQLDALKQTGVEIQVVDSATFAEVMDVKLKEKK